MSLVQAFSVERAIEILRDPTTKPIHKYLYLRNCQHFQPEYFYKMLVEHVQELLPLVYTPTVGEACMYYSNLPMVPIGMKLTLADKGHILEKLKGWPQQDVRVVVLTDGERILGLGDLGYGGLGISEGKILIYTAAAGVPPHKCLPLSIDVGTNNDRLLTDPEYKGLREKRLRTKVFDEIIDEIMTALQAWQPHILLQFEDFGNTNAFRLLDNYREKMCCFNDDIQGTACITLAGILSALRATDKNLSQQTFLFFGAGEAGTGIGELISQALERYHGMSITEARKHCYFIDSKGLVCASRKDLQHHKIPFAHDVEFCPDIPSAIAALKPTALIGVSTIPQAFTESVLKAMAAINSQPIIFPLSNPTSKSECTYQQAMDATNGTCLFASGSPFDPLMWNGVEHTPAQANNAYIFPCVGFAAVMCGCSMISDDVFLAAAYRLSELQKKEDILRGFLFPPFQQIQEISVDLGAGVLKYMFENGYAKTPMPGSGEREWADLYRAEMWHPSN